ncbi:MAG: hypothetical protein E7021_02015 [Alphaproteobacteria bacterium]|nr:hypothetical protein [Alphaproteobacteria bacterium]
MTNMFTAKTNFTAGELSPDLLGRVDLTSYHNGAQVLENVFIEPTGGVHRRPGLKFIYELQTKGRLIGYEQDSGHTYLLVIQNYQTKIFQNDILIETLSSPWSDEQINQIRWCCLSDGIIVVHPDIAPQHIRLENEKWNIQAFEFLTTNGYQQIPYHRFNNKNTSLSASGCTGNVSLTSSAPLFETKHIDQVFKLASGYVKITQISDAQHANATVLKKLIDDKDATNETKLEPTRYWGEVAWNDEHGWPINVTTYQSRLVFGGSKSLPNTLWFSQSNDLGNFEEGDALDNQAICFSLMSDQGNKIVALFSGRHLQVFTTGSEWMVSGNPLTPESIQVHRQTQVGSPDESYVPPVGIDGATIFASANGKEIREFLFSDLEGIYQATDLSLLAHHLINHPIDMAYDKYQRQAYIIMQDGSMSALTSFRGENIQSWTRHKTQGKFLNVAVLGKNTYFIIQRKDKTYLEKMDDEMYMDFAQIQTSENAKTNWDGWDYLNGWNVQLLADGRVQENQDISNGTIQLNINAQNLQSGLAFTHKVAPLPPGAPANNGSAPVVNCRFVRGVFRLINTKSFEIDTGCGVHQEINENLTNYVLDSAPTTKTTDIVVRGLGWKRKPTEPLWMIQGNKPLPFQLVSVTCDIKIGG